MSALYKGIVTHTPLQPQTAPAEIPRVFAPAGFGNAG